MGENTDAADGGSYRLLARGEDYRVGVAVERQSGERLVASIELLVRLFRTGERIRPEDVERALELVKKLEGMGYSVCFQEDGWISCEKPAGDTDAGAEAQRLQTILGGR